MAVAAHFLRILDQGGDDICGESEGKGHEGWIDVTGWNWEVADESLKKSAPAKNATGKGATSGAAGASAGAGEVGIDPSLFTFTKAVDRSTTRLMQEMYQGHVLQKATFTLIEEMVDVNRKYRDAFRLDVVLEHALRGAVQLAREQAEKKQLESSQVRIEIETLPSDADVILDGERRGSTPLELELTQAKTYTLELRESGRQSVTRRLETDENQKIFIALPPATSRGRARPAPKRQPEGFDRFD